MENKFNKEYLISNETSCRHLEYRLIALFGINSLAMKAFNLVREEMCIEKGFKRDDGWHFYSHCVAVANILLYHGVEDQDVICAALLHDLVEDVKKYTAKIITNLFNKNISRLVMLVTKDKDTNYKKSENIIEYLEVILQDEDASAIKVADRMHNMLTLQHKTIESKYNKAIETEICYLPFIEDCIKKYSCYESLFNTVKDQISSMIFEIKTSYYEIKRLQNEIDNLKEN